MTEKEMFAREIKHLRARGNAAYRQKDDEMLLKIITCLCKTAETQFKLAGEEDNGRMEIVFCGEDEEPSHAP